MKGPWWVRVGKFDAWVSKPYSRQILNSDLSPIANINPAAPDAEKLASAIAAVPDMVELITKIANATLPAEPEPHGKEARELLLKVLGAAL